MLFKEKRKKDIHIQKRNQTHTHTQKHQAYNDSCAHFPTRDLFIFSKW